jgi:Transposase
MQPQAPAACAAFVGLDWADATHALCLQVASAARRALRRLAHRPAVIDAWVCTLRTRCNGPPMAICLALNQGPMVSALQHDACLGLFPVNPRTVAKDRAAFTPSRATDDPTDAARQVELLLTHRDQLTPLVPHSPMMRALAPRVAHRRRLVGDKVR